MIFFYNLEKLILNKEAFHFLKSNIYQIEMVKVQVDPVMQLSHFFPL